MKAVFFVFALTASSSALAEQLRIISAPGGLYSMTQAELNGGNTLIDNTVPGNEQVARFLAAVPYLHGTACDATLYTINQKHYVYELKNCTPFK